MRAELRPSSLGEILDRTAQMYRGHFALFFGIAGVMYGVVLVLRLVMDAALFGLGHRLPVGMAGLSVISGGVFTLLSILPIAFAMAAAMHATAQNYLGHVCTIRDAYSAIGRTWYRYILILLATYVYLFLPLGVVAGGLGAAAALAPAGVTRVTIITLAVLLFLAGIVVVAYLALRWALAVPASLMEKLEVHASLKRSSVLTQGARGRIFVMLLLMGALMSIIQYTLLIPAIILAIKSKGALTLATQIVTAVSTFLSGSLVLPIYSIALTLFYYDQRIRKEGYDVEWLMEQASLAPGQTSRQAPAASETLAPVTPPDVTPSRPVL